jgi:6-phosphofructokinase 1
VTCGGLCPGLNVVIRELVMSLWYNYGAREIYGIKFGYKGFYNYDWLRLEPKNVSSIHQLGGTMLGSSRGGFDLEKIMNAILAKKISQVYVIGGDGTHKGATELFREIVQRKLPISIVGIPKTIDNDVPYIDTSFGFATAVEEAQRSIESADVEANCAENGVGLVKLMGRDAGHVAVWPTGTSTSAWCLSFLLRSMDPMGCFTTWLRDSSIKGTVLSSALKEQVNPCWTSSWVMAKKTPQET